jgi:hypothetical protein
MHCMQNNHTTQRKSSYKMQNNLIDNLSYLSTQFEGLSNFSIFVRACTPHVLKRDCEKIVLLILIL